MTLLIRVVIKLSLLPKFQCETITHLIQCEQCNTDMNLGPDFQEWKRTSKGKWRIDWLSEWVKGATTDPEWDSSTSAVMVVHGGFSAIRRTIIITGNNSKLSLLWKKHNNDDTNDGIADRILQTHHQNRDVLSCQIRSTTESRKSRFVSSLLFLHLSRHYRFRLLYREHRSWQLADRCALDVLLFYFISNIHSVISALRTLQ